MKNVFKYVIVDDNDTDRLILSLYLKDYPFLVNKATFSVPEDGLIFFEKNDADILFLDIEMDNINGLEFLKRVGNKVKCPVFTTSHSEFALNGFDLKAKDYLLKPLSKDRLHTCVENIRQYLEINYIAQAYGSDSEQDIIMLKSGTSYVNVNQHDIVYLAALKDYTKIVLHNNKTVTIHGNIGSLLRTDHFNDYVRIHKSYAVKKSKIEQISPDKILLENGVSLPLGGNYKKALIELINAPLKLSGVAR